MKTHSSPATGSDGGKAKRQHIDVGDDVDLEGNAKKLKQQHPAADSNKTTPWLLCRMIPNELFASAIVGAFLNRHETQQVLESVGELQDYVGRYFCPTHFTVVAPAAAASSNSSTPGCLDCHMHDTKRQTRCEDCRAFVPDRQVQLCLVCKTRVCNDCGSKKRVVLHPKQQAVEGNREGYKPPRLCTNCDVCPQCLPNNSNSKYQGKTEKECDASVVAAAAAVEHAVDNSKVEDEELICCPGPFCSKVYCRRLHSPSQMVATCDDAMFCRPRVFCSVCTDEFDKQQSSSGSSKCSTCPRRMCWNCTSGDKEAPDKQCARCNIGHRAFANFMGFGGGGGIMGGFGGW